MDTAKRGLTYCNLRIIAYISLLIDHFGALILDKIPWTTNEAGELLVLATRMIGRLAMPIFAFFIAEGMIRTRSRRHYILRLLTLAVITEIPYDLVSCQKPFAFENQNVIWSLLAGAILIIVYDKFKERIGGQRYILGCIAVCILMAGLMYLMRSEYMFLTPAIVLFSYVFRYDKQKMIRSIMISFLFLYALEAACSAIENSSISVVDVAANVLLEFVGMFGIYLIAEYYNEEKGKAIPRIINYGFFPFQFIFFYVLKLLIF